MQNNFETLSNKEYLLTNGIGGYCSASVSGANTRRYHGLLVAAFNPPTERLVLVSKLEETLVINRESFELSSNQYPDKIHPQGYSFIQNFVAETDKATWLYTVNGCQIQKTISVVQGQNTVVVTYQNLSAQSVELQLMPLLVYRDYHAMFFEQEKFDFYTEEIANNYLKIYAEYGAKPVYMQLDKGDWKTSHNWYKRFQYKQEEARGFNFEEDAISIGKADIELAVNEIVQIIFSTNEIEDISNNTSLFKIEDNKTNRHFIDDLITSSRQFIVHRKSTNGSTVIAGYHWFTDWGRDTMIALRGISIATGNEEEARSILQTFFDTLSEGMLPNRFPDYANDTVEYNTIDATLWLFVALYDYHEKFTNNNFITSILPQLKSIINWHIKGTRFNIHTTEEGLLYGGEIGYQLTWMDARIGDFVVTPRIGCPVEINVLWYNALCIYNYFSTTISGKEDAAIAQLSTNCKAAFVQYFWNKNDYLNDVIIPNSYVDASIRPNQIYAVSLPFSPLNIQQQTSVLNCVETNLLTAFGLRTLNKENPDFKPIYQGDAWHRDNAYHQGTVWPFLWGEWAMAFLKLNKFSETACKKIWEHTTELQNHFYNEGCAFAIAEIFDGLKPNTGKGCVQQAWSVGNMLNVFLNKDWKL